MCVGIGRILGAGRSVRTRMVACLSVLPCLNAWHKPSMAIGVCLLFCLQSRYCIPYYGAKLYLKLCLAWSQSLNLCLEEQIVGLKG